MHKLEKITIEIDTTRFWAVARHHQREVPGLAEYEAGRILLTLAGQLRNGSRPMLPKDLNGNTVGRVTYQTSEETHEDA
jgi:hypothetical protein